MSAITTEAVAAPAGSRGLWADLSVNIKILVAICVAAVVALIIGVLGLRSLSDASTAAQQIYQSNVLGVAALGSVQNGMTQTRLDLSNHALNRDPTAKQNYLKQYTADVEAVTAAWAEYDATGPVPEKAMVDDVKADWQAFLKIADEQLVPAAERNDLNTWVQIRNGEMASLVTEVKEHLAEMTVIEKGAAEKAAADARSGYESNRIQSISLLVGGILAALLLGLFVARGIVRSLNRVTEVCEGLADGDLTRSTGLTSHDEPGRMGRALDAAITRLRDTVNTIGGSAATLAGASEELSAVSAQLQNGASDVAEKAGSASSASEEVNTGVQSIAAGAEQMSASITEIASNAADAARVAQEGMSVAERTNNQVAELGAASAEIGDVVRLITSIAEQTNLLALNATIEAARAGELGKGFAVVAGEVKELAQQTAKATEEITERIGAIQVSSDSAAAAIGEITQVIQRIGDYTTTIASAVEEQTATTGEMSRSVADAATSSGEVARTVSGVAEVAAATADGARATQQAAVDLTRLAGDLTNLVGGFRH
ncbi:methyl-accepting chemotaxis protein [Actinoplanes sp. NPDC024001]|uniref:methyl-accepting chemotaxis protein n=1 Tax=Actinoplanes sp. NPDC024001 TaxID=3154598 RepID=UPI0033CCAE88